MSNKRKIMKTKQGNKTHLTMYKNHNEIVNEIDHILNISREGVNRSAKGSTKYIKKIRKESDMDSLENITFTALMPSILFFFISNLTHIKSYSTVITTITALTILLELINMFIACVLYSNIRRYS